MNSHLPDVIAGCYLFVAVLFARPLYGRVRARAIEENGLDWYRNDKVVQNVATWTFVGSMAWGVSLILLYVISKPPKTPQELEAENKRLSAEVARMEKEAGLR
jgi:hypothetical protein